MDCGILVDPEGDAARCLPMTDVRKGDRIVVGRQGLRVFPAETPARQNLFEFMASPVSSEKPKGVTVREIAAAMQPHQGGRREDPGRARPGRRPHRQRASTSAG